MSSIYLKSENFFNNPKNFYLVYIFLVVFLCVVKIPSLLSSDIQPWDEGMYATRVLSILTNGDFIDQSSHSVGKFYSGSHPPLLIWLGYFASLIFGANAVTFKLLIFIFALLNVLLIMLTGKKLFSPATGFFAAVIFCSNIIFEVFSQRFQFDIPYTFFILLSFYSVFLYNDSLKKRYLLLSGLSFGCCLMIKILVGFYIPMILILSYFFIKGKVRFSFKDLAVITLIGIAAALPWHLYMFANYGNDFTDYFFKFHIFDRAMQGVEMNEKRSGVFYHINYFLSILPFGIIAFLTVIKDLKNFKSLSWQNVFLCVWFLTGLFIITLFKTKLEVYVLLILIPGSFLIPLFLEKLNAESKFTKSIVVLLTFFNIFWFATESIRPELKIFASESNKLFLLAGMLLALIILYVCSRFVANKIELKKIYYIFILIFFMGINTAYLFNVPEWANKFQLSEIEKYAQAGKAKSIIYIGTNYRYNPQFSFYFKGLNLNWENPEYRYELLDTKDGFEIIKNKITQNSGKNLIIVEKDYINRADYPDSHLFIPENYKQVMKKKGYELYEN